MCSSATFPGGVGSFSDKTLDRQVIEMLSWSSRYGFKSKSNGADEGCLPLFKMYSFES